MISLRRHFFLCGAIFLLFPASLQGQFSSYTYIPTPGLEEVRAAVGRLEREGNVLRPLIREDLLREGRAILDLEQSFADGSAPSVVRHADFFRRLDAYNARPREQRTQAELDQLNAEKEQVDRLFKAEDAQVERRIASFNRAAAHAFEQANSSPVQIGSVNAMQGEVSFVPAGETGFRPLKMDDLVTFGGTIKTGSAGAIQLVMKDDSVIKIGADAVVTLDAFTFDPEPNVEKRVTHVVKGIYSFVTGRMKGGPATQHIIRLHSGYTVVRGTDLLVDVAENGAATITVFEGLIEFTSDQGGEPLSVAGGGQLRIDPQGAAYVKQADLAAVKADWKSRGGNIGSFDWIGMLRTWWWVLPAAIAAMMFGSLLSRRAKRIEEEKIRAELDARVKKRKEEEKVRGENEVLCLKCRRGLKVPWDPNAYGSYQMGMDCPDCGARLLARFEVVEENGKRIHRIDRWELR